jgi:hypothetical protein
VLKFGLARLHITFEKSGVGSILLARDITHPYATWLYASSRMFVTLLHVKNLLRRSDRQKLQ